MHTIFHFEAQEFKSPTLQTVCKLELKQRSFGRLKTTASSCAKISQLRNELRKFRSPKPISQRNPLAKFCKVFRSCETTYKHTCATSQVETPSSQLRTTLRNHLQAANQVANHLQVAESPPSCGITSKLLNKKFNLQNQSSNLQNG